MMKPLLGALVGLLCLSATAQAAEPVGCDKFRWPMDRERAALTADGVAKAAPDAVRAVAPTAFELTLLPSDTAKLPRTPERAPKPGTFAGTVAFGAPPAGPYQVTLSDVAWLDLVQGDAFRKPSAFSGATGCTGVRKVVRFDLDGSPFVLQLSGAPVDHLRVMVEAVPAE
ncbi:MAG: hypothetical protein ACRYGP_11740 [Janthinobacterium lividum]